MKIPPRPTTLNQDRVLERWLDRLAAAKITTGTSQASTTGSAVTFTGIPAGVKRITVNLVGVSLSGTDNLLFQIGDIGGLENASYVSSSIIVVASASSSAAVTSTAGFVAQLGTAAATVTGRAVLELADVTTDTWTYTFSGFYSTNNICLASGYKALSDTLTQLSLTRTGTDTFDAGSVNITYE